MDFSRYLLSLFYLYFNIGKKNLIRVKILPMISATSDLRRTSEKSVGSEGNPCWRSYVGGSSALVMSLRGQVTSSYFTSCRGFR